MHSEGAAWPQRGWPPSKAGQGQRAESLPAQASVILFPDREFPRSAISPSLLPTLQAQPADNTESQHRPTGWVLLDHEGH